MSGRWIVRFRKILINSMFGSAQDYSLTKYKEKTGTKHITTYVSSYFLLSNEAQSLLCSASLEKKGLIYDHATERKR